jgi:predicted nucleotidyltransferase
MSQVPKVWTNSLIEWLESEPSVSNAWIFGSRAKGTASTKSDLDIAIALSSSVSDPLSEWIHNAECWRERAQTAIGPTPTIDLQLASPDSDERVWPAVKAHGISFYRREDNDE